MSAATLATPVSEPRGGDGGRAVAVRGRRLTLDESIVGVWEGLHCGHPAACPVCGGRMVSSPATGARPVAARCSSCHAQLS